jgi:hypothetical protein
MNDEQAIQKLKEMKIDYSKYINNRYQEWYLKYLSPQELLKKLNEYEMFWDEEQENFFHEKGFRVVVNETNGKARSTRLIFHSVAAIKSWYGRVKEQRKTMQNLNPYQQLEAYEKHLFPEGKCSLEKSSTKFRDSLSQKDLEQMFVF